ncbi:13613_t:CDS:2, partial [Gigaspora rosea]
LSLPTLFNNQDIFLLYHDKYQQTLNYKVDQLAESLESQTNLIETKS